MTSQLPITAKLKNGTYNDLPFCKNEKTHLRKKLTKLGYKTYYCGKCDLTYNERTGTPYNHLSIHTDVLFLVQLYRLRYKLSLRDVAEIFLERGFEFTHEAVRDWEERFAHLFTAVNDRSGPFC